MHSFKEISQKATWPFEYPVSKLFPFSEISIHVIELSTLSLRILYVCLEFLKLSKIIILPSEQPRENLEGIF